MQCSSFGRKFLSKLASGQISCDENPFKSSLTEHFTNVNLGSKQVLMLVTQPPESIPAGAHDSCLYHDRTTDSMI